MMLRRKRRKKRIDFERLEALFEEKENICRQFFVNGILDSHRIFNAIRFVVFPCVGGREEADDLNNEQLFEYFINSMISIILLQSNQA